MPNGLQPLHMNKPGVLGINTQDSEGILAPEFAVKAVNMTLDEKGRLTLMPGSRLLGDTNNQNFEQIASLNVSNAFRHYGTTASRNVYELISDTWTQLTINAGVGGTQNAHAIYRFVSFNGKTILIAYASTTSGYLRHVQTTPGGAFSEIAFASGTCGISHDVLSAWGRLWTIDSTTLRWCALLDETNWTTGGGSIDLRNVWPGGQDYPVGLAEFNGFLVIFGRRSIIVYENPDDVANIAKVEAIEGVGLTHVNTIQDTGTDLLFMSQGGLMSLSRVIQEKSMPVSVIAPQVRDDMRQIMDVTAWTAEEISSAYSDRLGWYILSSDATQSDNGFSKFVVHTKQRDANGFMPVTTYEASQNEASYYCVCNDPEEGMILGASKEVTGANRGVCRIDTSTASVSTTAAAGTGGKLREAMEYESGWLDFREVELGDRQKILKELRVIFEDVGAGASTNDTLVVTLYGDYDETSSIYTLTTDAPYDASKAVTKQILDISGEVDVVKINIKITEPSDRTSLTRLSLYAKPGKLSQ